MLLRFLSNLIKPTNEQLRSKTNGKLARLKIWLYQLLLRRLLKTYLHYAISDSIVINNGDIKIVHEFRDLGFENELIRNKIGFKPEMISHSIPILMRKGKASHYFSYFNFKDLLSVYVDGKELFIKHDEAFSIDGTIDGKLKCSSRDCMFSQSVINVLSSCAQTQANVPFYTNADKSSKDTVSRRKPQQRIAKPIFGRDRDDLTIAPVAVSRTDERKTVCDNQPKAIEKKGFDIDTSF